MRIIAGKYKNKRIETLNKNDTRPTSEKLRESMFSSLQDIYGDVLDLFGGSGSLGIEALSRGAEHAIFIDGASDAIKVIKGNVKGLDEEIEIYRNDYRRALKTLKKRHMQFDFIFLDPPYNKKIADVAIRLIDELNLLKETGTIIVESGRDERIKTDPFIVKKSIVQGTTQVKFLRRDLDE